MIHSIKSYIVSKKSVEQKIKAIDALIDAIILQGLETSEDVGITIDEYSLDDGQMKIRTSYRSVKDIQKGIEALEATKQMYVNRLNGRVMTLRDVRSL